MEFLPWSRKTLNNALSRYQTEKKFSILDIELGGSCNFRCVYCDTPKYQSKIQYNLTQIEDIIVQGNIEWLFVCGLGEPTVGNNLQDFKALLFLCKKHNIKCSAFSNIAAFDDDLFDYVQSNILYPLFKLDSFEIECIQNIYGVSEVLASKNVYNAQKICRYVNFDGEYTNVCASIVPSTMNQNQLENLVDWCYDNNIFPLIGDLEDAGKGQNTYNSLKVSDERLSKLKSHIFVKTNEDYRIPICPSVLFGIHISFDGYVVLDQTTGLSCHWFWLTEPQIYKLIRLESNSYEIISKKIIEYREKQKLETKNNCIERDPLIFGGCGGDIVELLSFYLENMC